MADKLDGTDNVFILGVKPDEPLIPARTQEQVDSMLTESLAIQKLQIDDFLGDLRRFSNRQEIINYGSLMKHLQQECVYHLSALASASLLRIQELEGKLQMATGDGPDYDITRDR